MKGVINAVANENRAGLRYQKSNQEDQGNYD